VKIKCWGDDVCNSQQKKGPVRMGVQLNIRDRVEREVGEIFTRQRRALIEKKGPY
jgi:hypothetical protein